MSDDSVLYSTFNHAFYDPVMKEYTQLMNFREGSALYVYNSSQNRFEFTVIKSIKKIDDYGLTYNLALGYPNNYLVDGIVVHNDVKAGEETIYPSPPSVDNSGGGGWSSSWQCQWQQVQDYTYYPDADITIHNGAPYMKCV